MLFIVVVSAAAVDGVQERFLVLYRWRQPDTDADDDVGVFHLDAVRRLDHAADAIDAAVLRVVRVPATLAATAVDRRWRRRGRR